MRQLGADVAHNDNDSLGRHLGDLSHHAVILDAHLLTDLKRRCAERLHALLLRLLLAKLLLGPLVGLLRFPLLPSCASLVDLLDLALDIILSFLLLLLLLSAQKSEESLKLLAGLLGRTFFRL